MPTTIHTNVMLKVNPYAYVRIVYMYVYVNIEYDMVVYVVQAWMVSI